MTDAPREPKGPAGGVLGPEADAEFLDLWGRLEDLTDAEWHRFYALLTRVLRRYSFPELGPTAANMSLEEAVQEFIVHKVYYKYILQPATRPALDHPGAVVPWFRHMLIDRRRARHSQGQDSLYGTSLNEPVAGREGEGAGERGDRLAHAGAEDPESALAGRELEAGAEALRQGARDLLAAEGRWAAAFLAFNTCVDSEQKRPLSRLRVDLGMGTSYHHHARRLGVTGPKRGAWEGFGGTVIGQWLREAGIEPDTDNQGLMAAAFKILCEEAFRMVQDQDPSGREP